MDEGMVTADKPVCVAPSQPKPSWLASHCAASASLALIVRFPHAPVGRTLDVSPLQTARMQGLFALLACLGLAL